MVRGIAVADSVEQMQHVYSDEVKRYLHDNFNVDLYQTYNKDEIQKRQGEWKDVTCIFSTWNMPVFSKDEVTKYFPGLQAVFYAAGSVQYFAKPFLESGIKIFSAREENAIPVAEYVASQIILSNKGYYQGCRKYRSIWFKFNYRSARKTAERKSGNFRSKIGIIGMGMIGKKVIEYLKPYDLDIAVCDPYIKEDELEKMNVEKMSLEEIFTACDVISNHMPDNEQTKDILNYKLFSLMKPTATFINTGRGRQVVEKDLAKAMKEKKEACALLDVTRHEPCFPWNPLLRCSNVFLTLHLAGSLSNEKYRLGQAMSDTFQDFISGRSSEKEITLEMLKHMA